MLGLGWNSKSYKSSIWRLQKLHMKVTKTPYEGYKSSNSTIYLSIYLSTFRSVCCPFSNPIVRDLYLRNYVVFDFKTCKTCPLQSLLYHICTLSLYSCFSFFFSNLNVPYVTKGSTIHHGFGRFFTIFSRIWGWWRVAN